MIRHFILTHLHGFQPLASTSIPFPSGFLSSVYMHFSLELHYTLIEFILCVLAILIIKKKITLKDVYVYLFIFVKRKDVYFFFLEKRCLCKTVKSALNISQARESKIVSKAILGK